MPIDESVCRWRPDATVHADMVSVTVGDIYFSVLGEYGRSGFEHALRVCDVSAPTVGTFAAWRRARLATNITAVVGVAVFPEWIAAAVFAVEAGDERLRFVEQLQVDVDGAPAAGG